MQIPSFAHDDGGVGSVDAFQNLMRRYSFAYTAAHDFSQLADLMVDDYVLLMGEHEIRGRDGEYRAATTEQYTQFPGLGFTVHDVITNGDRFSLVFTEHGASRRRRGRAAAWRGISLYRWDRTRLIECRVEQDYWARRRQLAGDEPDEVAPPHLDPWTTHTVPEDRNAVASVYGWLRELGVLSSPVGTVDSEAVGAEPDRVQIDEPNVEVLDIFSAGRRVPFAIRISGLFAGGLSDLDKHLGDPMSLYVTGVAAADAHGGVRLVTAVTDRLGLVHRLTADDEPVDNRVTTSP
ncbi:MAG TPA: nuclear transport factor 2 family protein [Jatrophihabitantaceae bacterium]